MPYMRITAGLDGFWHLDTDGQVRQGCGAIVTGRTAFIGGQAPGGHKTMPDPPRHEMCPVCLPIRTASGSLPGAEMYRLFQLGFREMEPTGYSDPVVFTNPSSSFLTQVWVQFRGPTTLADRWYDARDHFDLRAFHAWWEEVSLVQLHVPLKLIDSEPKVG